MYTYQAKYLKRDESFLL